MTASFQADTFQNDTFEASSNPSGAANGTGAASAVGSALASSTGVAAGIGSSAVVSGHTIFWDTSAAGYVKRNFGMFIHWSLFTFYPLGTPAPFDQAGFDPGNTLSVTQWIAT